MICLSIIKSHLHRWRLWTIPINPKLPCPLRGKNHRGTAVSKVNSAANMLHICLKRHDLAQISMVDYRVWGCSCANEFVIRFKAFLAGHPWVSQGPWSEKGSPAALLLCIPAGPPDYIHVCHQSLWQALKGERLFSSSPRNHSHRMPRWGLFFLLAAAYLLLWDFFFPTVFSSTSCPTGPCLAWSG